MTLQEILQQSELDRMLSGNVKPYKNHAFSEYNPTFQEKTYDLVNKYVSTPAAKSLVGNKGNLGLMDFTGFNSSSENIARAAGRGIPEGNLGDVALGFGLLGMDLIDPTKGIRKVAKPAVKAIKKRMSKQEGIDLGYYHPLSNTKLKKPIQDMTSKVMPFKNVKTPKIITPEDLYKEKLAGITTKGDRTNIGLLTEVEGIKLAEEVPLYGGPRFSDYNPDIWSSNKGQITTITNKAKGLLDEGYNPATIYTTSGHDALRFNTMLTDGFLQEIKAINLPKKSIKEFDDALRKIRPEWVGINNPEARNQLLQNGTLRTHFNEIGGQAKFQGKGFPDITPIKKGITDPNLLNTPNMMSGYRVGKIDPNNMIITNPKMPHPTYNTNIGGTQIGELGVQMPHKELFPDFYKKRRASGDPVSGDNYAVERGYPTQKFNQEWLDSVMPLYEERLKKLQGLL
tara:strand:+ start:91 stop:1452 length:1362 start_codon:yes stop_codon:yes gene_type:complete